MKRQTGYTVKKVEAPEIDVKTTVFMIAASHHLSREYGEKFNFDPKRIESIVATGDFWVCWKGEDIVGFMFARRSRSLFDPEKVMLIQHLLFALPQTKGAFYLLKEFIDFGKHHADHIITMIAEKTNIKERSLERLGFSKLETMYRMETHRGVVR